MNAVELLEILYAEKSRPSLRWLRKMTAKGIIPVEYHGRMVFYVPSQVLAALNRFGRFQQQERQKRKTSKPPPVLGHDTEKKSEQHNMLGDDR